MKKIITSLTALIVAFSMSAFAADKAAEVKPDDAKPAQVKKTDEKKHDGKKKAHHRNHFRGEVKAVDAKAGTVTVSRGEKTFTADEKLLSGIKVGDRISVRFAEKDGQLTATGIKAADEKKAHHRNHFRGEVKAVDAKAGTVTVKGRNEEKTFAADEKLLSGAKVGDKVSVRFDEKDGQLTATGISPAKAHHKNKEAKKAEEMKVEEKK